MKTFLSFMAVLFSAPCFSQTGTITVRKALAQDKMSTVVTLAGLYYGTCTSESVLTTGKLELSNSENGLDIIDFNIAIAKGDQRFDYYCKGAILSPEVMRMIQTSREKYIRIYLAPIRAITGKDTLYLNPIELKLTNLSG